MNENRACRFSDANHLLQSTADTSGDILQTLKLSMYPLYFFLEIEWRISKGHINRIVGNRIA